MGRQPRNTYHLDKPRGLWHAEAVAKVLDERFGKAGPKEGAEVGVYLAWFSEFMLKRYSRLSLFLVDPYPMDPGVWSDSLAKSKLDLNPENMRLVKQAAIDRMRPFGTRAEWIFSHAHEACADLTGTELDFAFLDHAHTYEAMVRDLPLWWDLVRRGGFLSGHDYKPGRSPRHRWKVNQAVDEFAAKIGKPVATGDGKTWYIFKD